MRLISRVLITALFFIAAINPAYAVFELRADNNIVDFGFMGISEVKELREKGSYHNAITCNSDEDNRWYLKIRLNGPLSSGGNVIAYENFKWRVSEVIGGDGIIYSQDIFRAFSDTPELVYTSGPNDSKGEETEIRFEYRLSIPGNQLPGNYRTVVRYTMTEML